MIHLDDKDHRILQVLNDHAEYTTRNIAKQARLPITTVHNRIKKLRSQGIIKRYTIVKDYEKLGYPVAAYILIDASLKELKEKHRTQADLVKTLTSMSFVEEAAIVTGQNDIVLKVRLSTLKDLNSCLLEKIQVLDGVERTQTLVIMNEV
ncbi:MAG: Lrp/AsnC family transcriptional regulator [Nanoarchaeota archaeon]